MKRKKDIYTRIIARDNIHKAIICASKRKRARGNVQRVMENIDNCVNYIQNMLITKAYKPSPYQKVTIMDGVRKKERIIFKPRFFPDQCIHWALMLQLEPILSKGMYDYCCASIKNRGILYGARYLKKKLVQDRKNTKYCLKLDIKKFYPNIDKEILKRKFRRIIKDGDTLDFLGYRFYRGYTTLRKSNFLRIKRRFKKISKKGKITYTDASASLSYYGWLKHCDSYNFNQKYVKPYVDLNKCKGVIRNESRKQFKT